MKNENLFESLNSDKFGNFETSKLAEMSKVVGGDVDTCKDYCVDTRTGTAQPDGSIKGLDDYIEITREDCDPLE